MAVSFTNFTAIHPPQPIAPVSHDFAYCDTFYGKNLDPELTILASAKIPEGGEEQQYDFNRPSSRYHLPFTVSWGGVTFSVEASISVTTVMQPYINVRPNDFRGMAGYLSHACVDPHNAALRTGGFITKRFSSLVNHILNPNVNIENIPYPSNTIFLTVTMLNNIERPDPFLAPGDRDPVVPSLLSDAEAHEYVRRPSLPESEKRTFLYRAVVLTKQSAGMRRGGEIAWWIFDEGKGRGGGGYGGSDGEDVDEQPASAGETAGKPMNATILNLPSQTAGLKVAIPNDRKRRRQQ